MQKLIIAAVLALCAFLPSCLTAAADQFAKDAAEISADYQEDRDVADQLLDEGLITLDGWRELNQNSSDIAKERVEEAAESATETAERSLEDLEADGRSLLEDLLSIGLVSLLGGGALFGGSKVLAKRKEPTAVQVHTK